MTHPLSSSLDVSFDVAPAGADYLAAATLHFRGGLLGGTRLTGFRVYRRRAGVFTVTMPSTTAITNGDRRTTMVLRPTSDATDLMSIKQAIITAYRASLTGGGR